MNEQVVPNNPPSTELAHVQGKAIGNLISNALFWGVGVVVVILLARWKRWLGLAGLVLYAVLAALDALQSILVLFSSPAVIRDLKSRGASAAELTRVRCTTLVRLLDDAVMIVYALFLYYWLVPHDG